MEESARQKLLEEKLIGSMKTEITLLKKLKHLAFHRSDSEGGCKCSSAQLALHSSASDVATLVRLNGMGTYADKFKRTGGLCRCGRAKMPTIIH